MPKPRQKKKPQVCVIWVRKQLDMSQSAFANLIGASMHTIQSIELGRLDLSERFAYKISEQTGVRARWLLANKLKGPFPDPKQIQEEFDRAQAGAWKGIYRAHLLPRGLFFRAYAFYRAVTSEIGYSGFKRAGGIKLLTKFCNDLVLLIEDKRQRKTTYQAARKVAIDSAENYRLALDDLRELQRNLREYLREESVQEQRKATQSTP
jgi:DNA-binding XRE family transcriptional regulator